MTLDVDNSLIEEKLRIISDDESQDNVIKWLQNNPERHVPKYKKVEPFPGVCIKTWLENGEKIFINLCHSKEIVAPEDISDEKLQELLTEEVPSFVIPMAIGTEKMAKDKEDVERSTFDILINTKYYEKCMQRPHFLQFTVAAIFESICDKYKKSIDLSKYVVLKNRKVMGSLDKFTIEDREPKRPAIKKPLIQVVDIPEETENRTKNADTAMKYNPKSNNYVIIESSGRDHLIGLFYLPSSLVTDIKVDVGERRVIVENHKTDVMIDTLLPHSIDYGRVFANFDSKLQILRLTLPLKK